MTHADLQDAPPTAAPVGMRGDVVVRLIAIERCLRGLVILVVGIVLAGRTHTDWASHLRDWADDLGLDPSRQVVVGRLINRVAALTPRQLLLIGLVAAGYGALELVEGVGLWRRYRWAEYLTVVATAVFIPVEVWEIIHRPSLLKIGGLLVNVAIVVYLTLMIRRRSRRR
jgi:uncharacterized membrane protein (DUF2068 family)